MIGKCYVLVIEGSALQRGPGSRGHWRLFHWAVCDLAWTNGPF